jgi:hypothetical protein
MAHDDVPAKRADRELVADPAPYGSRLHEPQMVRVRGLPSAQKARLRRHELQMGAVAVAARFAEGKGALVDMPEDGVVHRRCLGLPRRRSVRRRGRLRRCRRRRLLRTPPLAPASLRREGRFLGLKNRATSGRTLGSPVETSSEEILVDPELAEATLFDGYRWRDMAARIEWALTNRDKLYMAQRGFYDRQIARRTWQDVVADHVAILDRIADSVKR